MADIFGRQDLQYGGSFSADSAIVSMSSTSCIPATNNLTFGVGLLAQQLQFAYQQPIQRFFELGANKTYFFAGRPSGQGSIGRLLGPRAVAESFYQAFGNVCCAATNVMSITVGTACTFNGVVVPQPQGTTQQTWALSGTVLTTIGGMIAAEDMIFREQLQFVFFKLSPPTTLNTAPVVVGGGGDGGGSGINIAAALGQFLSGGIAATSGLFQQISDLLNSAGFSDAIARQKLLSDINNQAVLTPAEQAAADGLNNLLNPGGSTVTV